MLHDPGLAAEVGEGYDRLPLNIAHGLMSFRFLRLFCTTADEPESMDALLTFEQLQRFERDRNFIDFFICNERLEQDIFLVLEDCGVTVSAQEKADILAMPRENASSRRASLADYYDEPALQLVAKRDRLIIEKFNYAPPF